MAMTGGTSYKVFTSNAAGFSIDLYVYVVKEERNVAGNYTPLKLGMYVQTPGAAYDIDWGDNYGSYLGLGEYGGHAEQKTTFNKSVSAGGKIWLKENVSVTAYHNADGTAENVPIIWKWGVYSTWGGYYTPSGTQLITLESIPRVSGVSVNSGYIGSALNIIINSQSASFKHTLKYSFGSKSGVIEEKTDKTAYSWVPPMELCNEIPSANEGECTITCETYSGDTLIGSSTVKNILIVPNSVGLSLNDGWVTVVPDNSETKAEGINRLIAMYSKAKFVIDESKISTENSYGATVKSYKIKLGGKWLESAPYTSSLLTTAGEYSAICYVYDTRDRYVTVTLKFTVEAYSAPSITNVSCFRCDENGALQKKTGQNIYVVAELIYSSLGGDNTASLSVRYKPNKGSYSNSIELTSGTPEIIGNNGLSTKVTYVVEITAIDSLGNPALFTAYVKSASVFFRGMAGGKGAAFNKYPEHEGYVDMGFGIWMNDTKIKGVRIPEEADEAANKEYVDNLSKECSPNTFDIPLPRETDMNTLVTPCSFFCATWDDYNTMVNAPPNATAGKVEVTTASAGYYIYQKWHDVSNGIHERVGSNYGASWSAWKTT